MTPQELIRLQQRRTFLGTMGRGIGAAALASLLSPSMLRAAESATSSSHQHWHGVVNPLHFPARAKRVIWLTMAGGPSHLETFDYKPMLGQMNGKPMPDSFTKGQPIAQLQGQQLRCFAPQWGFQKFGKSQQEICELFPRIGAVSDEICIIRSMVTEAINHDPAHTFMNTGTTISGRPSMGSWALYGLGSDCDNLPGFVVMMSQGRGGQNQPVSARQWSSGFLPSRFQGVQFRGQGDPVLYLGRPGGVSAQRQRDVVNAVEKLNESENTLIDDPEIATRISQYEMAFAMQSSVPELMDLSSEPKEILEMYGSNGADGSFAANCIMARRLAERGVRFIQLYHRDWDHHSNLKNDIKLKGEEVDRPTAALITDLKNRGMLDETMVIWGGEFGRTPMAQGNGRDHHIKGFSMFACGGGVQGGQTIGATDELGYNAIEDICSIHDLHATMLYQMGIDHKKLTYKFQGRDFRLTDVSGNVVRKMLV